MERRRPRVRESGALADAGSSPISVLALSVALALAAACGDEDGNPAVPNQPPAATIDTPLNGETFVEGDTVEFRGHATDPEEGPLAGGALAWSSDLDGAIGTGATPSTDSLGAGEHRIALVATDSEGLADSAQITITITPSGPPVLPLTWVSIPGGVFTMGSADDELGRDADEGPAHEVTLDAFELTATEVTTSQYATWLNAEIGQGRAAIAGDQVKATAAGIHPDTLYVVLGASHLVAAQGAIAVDASFENYPALLITWWGADAFCRDQGWRLPTEAEWEFACRAGTATPLYNGALTEIACDPLDPNVHAIAWYCGNAPLGAQEVEQKLPNALGLYDLAGNASEWCHDWYGSGYYAQSPNLNPQGPDTGTFKVARGGDWGSHAKFCRSASRVWRQPGHVQTVTYGFRPAR
jgi:formylglycine-generating enzyme required for sulfatase activity